MENNAWRLIVVAVLLSGCSGDGANPSTSGTDAGASLDALRTAFCKSVRGCCAASGAPPEPLMSCESEFDRQFNFVHLVGKGTIRVDEPRLRACLARLDEQSKSCQPPEEVCIEALLGTLMEGAPCEYADECKDEEVQPIACLKTSVAADAGPRLGVCRAIPIGKAGDACSSSCPKGRVCSVTISTFEVDPNFTVCREDDGLYCDSTRHCAPILADGAPCEPTMRSCSSASFCGTICTPRKAEGSACASFAECRAGLACTSGACVPARFATPKPCSGDLT
jgi:hypothetical protein